MPLTLTIKSVQYVSVNLFTYYDKVLILQTPYFLTKCNKCLTNSNTLKNPPATLYWWICAIINSPRDHPAFETASFHCGRSFAIRISSLCTGEKNSYLFPQRAIRKPTIIYGGSLFIPAVQRSFTGTLISSSACSQVIYIGLYGFRVNFSVKRFAYRVVLGGSAKFWRKFRSHDKFWRNRLHLGLLTENSK